MNNKKISFLISAHNEEKIISKALSNLIDLPYDNYEVILGLDGCTDKTEEIVKDFCKLSEKIKYFNLNLRSGKPAVINKIIKKANGEIIIIHDADWIFKFDNQYGINKLISTFDDPNIGGISEYLPLEWDLKKIKNSNFGYKMHAYSSYLWYKFQQKRFTTDNYTHLNLKEPTMFLTNIFRKNLYKENSTLGDDFERSIDIMNQGYKIIILKDPSIPRMVASYDKTYIGDIFKQKVRTAVARNQIQSKSKVNIFNYYLPATMFVFLNSWKISIVVGIICTYWIIITSLGTLIAKFTNLDTKKGWRLRMRR